MASPVAFTDHSACNALTSLVQADSSNQPGARQRVLKRGQSLWLSEAPFDRVYRLEVGRVSIIGADETGRELLLRTIAAGDWFGDYCLCPGQQMPHPALEARADEDSQLVEVRHERWLHDLAASAAAVREFVTRSCLRLAQADRRLVMMARRSADERIGLLLLEQASADHRDVPAGCGKVTQTHAEIAQAAAMTRSHVSVTLGRFRRKGLIRYRRREAIIVQMQRLRTYVERLDRALPSPAQERA